MAELKLSKKVLKLIEKGKTVKAGDHFFEKHATGTADDIIIAKIANTIRYSDGIKTLIKDDKKK
jgi:hypothetical protein